MDVMEAIVKECYDLDVSAAACACILNAAGYGGLGWEQVADMYMEIECEEEGK